MYYIDTLKSEHEQIIKLTDHILKVSKDILHGTVNASDILTITDVIRNYADKYHHKKEEDLVFKAMLEYLGELAEKLVTSGMLVEHDLARYERMMIEFSLESYEKDKSDEARLELIGHLMSYRSLLIRHADKENKVVYPFAMKNLPEDVQRKLDEETRVFEEENKEQREKYLKIINDFEL